MAGRRAGLLSVGSIGCAVFTSRPRCAAAQTPGYYGCATTCRGSAGAYMHTANPLRQSQSSNTAFFPHLNILGLQSGSRWTQLQANCSASSGILAVNAHRLSGSLTWLSSAQHLQPTVQVPPVVNTSYEQSPYVPFMYSERPLPARSRQQCDGLCMCGKQYYWPLDW